MIKDSDVDKILREKYRLFSSLINIEVKIYNNSGGNQTRHPWKSIGYYAKQNKDERFVLEILYLKYISVYIIRVYKENKAVIYFAKKINDNIDKLKNVLDEAIDIFIDCIKKYFNNKHKIIYIQKQKIFIY